MTIVLPILLQLLERFQKMGLCLSYSSRNNILEHIGGHFQDSVIEAVKKRQKIPHCGGQREPSYSEKRYEARFSKRELQLVPVCYNDQSYQFWIIFQQLAMLEIFKGLI